MTIALAIDTRPTRLRVLTMLLLIVVSPSKRMPAEGACPRMDGLDYRSGAGIASFINRVAARRPCLLAAQLAPARPCHRHAKAERELRIGHLINPARGVSIHERAQTARRLLCGGCPIPGVSGIRARGFLPNAHYV